MEKELPKNWVEIDLENILDRMTNGVNLSQKDVAFVNSYPITRIETIAEETINFERVKYVGANEGQLQKYGLKKGDILFSHINSDKHLGKTAIYQSENVLIHGINLLLFRTSKYYNPYLLNYFLKYYRYAGKFMEVAQRAVNQSSINQKKLNSFIFPFPPLAEQHRIVAKLESLFAQLESIKTSMSKIPVLLKNFRQQVLTQAVTGKLTKEWREGKKITSEQLLCSIQEKRKILINRRDDKNDVFLNNHFLDIPNNWILVNLWDLAFLVTSGSRDWSQYYSEEGAYFVRSAEINNNKLRLKEAIKVNLPEKIEGKRSLIEKGNILITITGANVGKCALIEDSIPESYVSQSVALVKIVNTEISKFIHLSLLSRSDDGSQLENLAYGMGRPVLSLPQIKSVKIPLPSLEEQQEIVSRVESLFAKADAIEEKYKNLKAKIETLPQTILHKAFKGELTEQLETDGDAKVLLEEIAALKKEKSK